MPEKSPPPIRHRTRVRMPYAPATDDAPPAPMTCNPLQIEERAINKVQGRSRPLRRRKKPEIERHAQCIEEHAFDPPIVIDEAGRVLFGEDHLAAYRLLKRETVPTITLTKRSEAELEALSLWLEGFHAAGEWDKAALKDSFEFIWKNDPDLIPSTFWDLGDIDLIIHGSSPKAAPEGAEDDTAPPAATPVTRPGDAWVWPQGHRMICGDSRKPETYERLMAGRKAQVLASDPPYGIAVADISKTHEEWIDGSGMTEAEAAELFEAFLSAAKAHLCDGALVYVFIDGKGMYPLLGAVRTTGLEQKAICTWDKMSPGLGSFYRNQAEHVVVAKHGKGKHIFHAKCGQNTTIWSAPGYAQFRPDRAEALEAHACTKPQSILMGILYAGSNRGGVCLDPFSGSGSMTLAAERTGRICYSSEIDPRFIDSAISRMKKLTGEHPVHEESGLSFEALAHERGVPLPDAADLGDDEF